MKQDKTLKNKVSDKKLRKSLKIKYKPFFVLLTIILAFGLATTIITLSVVPILTQKNDKAEPIMSYSVYKLSTNDTTQPVQSSTSTSSSFSSVSQSESSILESSIVNPVSSGMIGTSSSSSSQQSSLTSLPNTSKEPLSTTSSHISSSNSSSYYSSKSDVTSSDNTTIYETTSSPETTQNIPDNTIEIHTHKYSDRIVSPTCTAKGYTLHTCNCGNSFADNYKKALGHSWSDWNTIHEATITSKGLDERICSRCSSKDYRYIDEIQPDNSPNSELSRKVIEILNEERLNNGLKPLKIDNSLMKSAYTRATELEESFNHQRPNGEQGYSLALELGYSIVGENIAAGQPSPEAVMKSWMNSAGHRSNILSPEFTHIGVGCYISNDGWLYWVQSFGG